MPLSELNRPASAERKGLSLFESFHSHADHRALVHGDEEVTYRELLEEVRECENLLNLHGVRAGEVVALGGDFSKQTLAAFLALSRNSNIIVPISKTVEPEIVERMRASGAERHIRFRGSSYEAYSVGNRSRHPLIEQLRNSGRSGLVLFSSGSTGIPRGMLHDLDTLLSRYTRARSRRLRVLLLLLFDHIGGLDVLFRALFGGFTLVIPEVRDVDGIAQLIQRHRIEVLPATPSFLNLMMISGAHERYDLSSLKVIAYGAESMPEPLLKQMHKCFPRTQLQQKFGTSETSAIGVRSRSVDSLFIKVDDPDTDYRIVEGELWLRSRTRILGYLNGSSEGLEDDNWYCTGDLVEENGDGYFKIIGRKHNLINVGGRKVLPLEIESLLLSEPYVADCIVRAEENLITGQAAVAEIVLDGTVAPQSAKRRLRRLCRERLAAYKQPVRIRVVNRITTNERFKKMR